ncbi:MAG: transcriptional regulator [Candidatus Micrarchaeota archaeon]|nr:transcriptional regulator [Candidatus Micrarchaeota archaeon]
MADLTPIEQIVVKAMEELGATKDSVIKTADDITKKSNRPKGLVTNALTSLSQKGVIKRVAREKASGYYVVNKA